MSEKESLEKQLDQAQKMEALGTLVGGIAHDFNNMLGGITSNLFLARSMAGDNHTLQEKLKHADALCFRSADMIKQLLAFARRDQVAMKDLALINGDATQMQQILLNLLKNACHALRHSEKPRICIHTRIVEPDDRLLAIHPDAVSGPHICLSVSDNGSGIPEKIRHRIFEPFFTTRSLSGLKNQSENSAG